MERISFTLEGFGPYEGWSEGEVQLGQAVVLVDRRTLDGICDDLDESAVGYMLAHTLRIKEQDESGFYSLRGYRVTLEATWQGGPFEGHGLYLDTGEALGWRWTAS